MKGKKILLPITLAALTLVGCGKKNPEVKGRHTYNTFTSVSPSNWNELTYQDNNDLQILSYISGSFFNYDFAFDNDGNIIDGEFETCFDGATALTDVTATYAGDSKYSVPAGKTSGYAYKITLRDDLKWDDGTPIHAKDFVYTMKQQLDPLFQNYRADSFYVGSNVIHNAFNYVKQGQSVMKDNEDAGIIEVDADLDKSSNIFKDSDGNPIYIALDVASSYLQGDAFTDYLDYFAADETSLNGLLDAMEDDEESAFYGYAPLNATTYGFLKDLLDNTSAAWGESNADFYHYLHIYTPVPTTSFDTVGIFTGDSQDPDNNELIVVLDKSLELLEGDQLSYKAAYNFSSLPLVKEDLYESCKIQPTIAGGLWTTNYNSSLATTASWGPYKLVSFQAGKEYVLEKNENWYGWNKSEYEGQYQTDRIVCKTIESAQTAWLSFKKGDIDDIGISQGIGNTDCKNSERAFFTGDDFVGSLQLQSRVSSLKENQETATQTAGHGVNKTILGNVKFRKAISVGFNRAEYLQATTVASKPGFGLFNQMHYYDVAHGKAYRNENVAKKVICDVYGVEYTEANLDEKYESVTGYNIDLARQLVREAYEEEIASAAEGHLLATDVIVFDVDVSTINEATNLRLSEMQKQFNNIVKNTPLEGKVTLVNVEKGKTWANDFRAGSCEICTGGWTGAAWDPGYFLLAYLSPNYMYSSGWDTSAEKLTLTLTPEDANDPQNITDVEHSLMDWYDLLNGEWSEGAVSNGFRLQLIAALEKAVLTKYYSIPLENTYTASLLSYKLEYITRDYNTFMNYGGIRYMTYNYDDYEWWEIKGSHDYTK